MTTLMGRKGTKKRDTILHFLPKNILSSYFLKHNTLRQITEPLIYNKKEWRKQSDRTIFSINIYNHHFHQNIYTSEIENT